MPFRARLKVGDDAGFVSLLDLGNGTTWRILLDLTHEDGTETFAGLRSVSGAASETAGPTRNAAVNERANIGGFFALSTIDVRDG